MQESVDRGAERPIQDIGRVISKTPLDELQLPRQAAQDLSGRVITSPDEKTRALLALILRELQKQTYILANAFSSEIGGMDLSKEDLEV